MSGKIVKNGMVFLILALCIASVWCVQPICAQTTGSVSFTYEGVEGCTFSMYYVADYSESDGYTLASDFEDTSMSRTDLEDGKWYALAMTLETLVVCEDISPIATDKTDADGVVSFSNLTEGLYLVTIERMTIGSTVYTAQPLLIMVPQYYSDGSTNYNETYTITKYEVSTLQEKVDVSVQKVWDDEDSSENRPASIEVYLMRGSDGEVVDTQVLGSSNNWRFTWTDLDGSEVWYVAEEGLTDYGVSYSMADDGTIVITNQQGTGKTYGMHNVPPDSSEDSEIIIIETTETETTESTEPSEEESENSSGGSSGGSGEPATDSEDMIYQDVTESELESELATESEPETEDDSGKYSDNSQNQSGTSGGSSGDGSDKLPQTGPEWRLALLLIGVAFICLIIGRRKYIHEVRK